MKPKIKDLIKKIKENELLEKIRKNKLLRIPLGTLFIILGMLGGFIPIFQGWIFLLIGILILFGPEIIKLEKHKK